MTDKTTAADEAHSDVVGGSSASRVINCPGSVRLAQKVARAHKERIVKQLCEAGGDDTILTLDECGPAMTALVEKLYREETTSEYAEEGTDLHTCMETILEQDLDVEEVAGRKFGNTIITEELFEDFVVPALDAFDEYCDLVFEEDGEELEFLIEKKVKIPGVPGGFGTTDIGGKTSKRMTILDWKGGAGVPVSPVENSQGLFYGRGFAHTCEEWLDFPLDERTNQPDKDLRVDIIIVQPRTQGPAWEMWTTTYGRLEQFRSELVVAVTEALRDDDTATIKEGDHCRWCPAKHICPRKQNLAGRIMERIDAGADAAVEDTDNDPADVSTKDAVDMTVSQADFTPEELAEWLAEADEAEVWIKAVRSLARSELDAGRDVPGKGLDQGLANACYNIEESKIDRRLAGYGLDVKERREVTYISATTARKLVKAKLKAAEGEEAIAEAQKNVDNLEKIIHRPPGKISMKDTDKIKNPVVTKAARREELREKLDAVEKE